MSRVLLVDDDLDLANLFKAYLDGEGFTADVTTDGEEGIRRALAGDCDIVVLDVMMPGLSGFDVLRRIRAASNVPVVMLTAKGEPFDRVLGLEFGADDYVPKPCMPRELVARIRAILRRTASAPASAGTPTSIEVGHLHVHLGKRQAAWKGAPVNLTGTEYKLLELLALHAGSPVSKRMLCEQGLGREFVSYDRSVDVHMSSIRQKLGPMADGRSCIQTVIRHGYQLVVE